MLLEINCNVDHYMEFLQKAEEAGIKPDFDMRGADEHSGFGLAGQPDEPIEPIPDPELEILEEEM